VEGSVAGASTSGGSVAVDPVTGDSVAGDSVAEGSVAGDSVTGGSVVGDSVIGDSVAGDSVMGGSVTGASAIEDSVGFPLILQAAKDSSIATERRIHNHFFISNPSMMITVSLKIRIYKNAEFSIIMTLFISLKVMTTDCVFFRQYRQIFRLRMLHDINAYS